MRPVSVRLREASSLAALPPRVHRRAAWLGVLVVALALAGPAGAATYLVRPDGTGDFPTIQDAIDAATGGDTILLANGVFTGSRNRDLSTIGKAITLRSQSGSADACIIDCQGSAGDPHRGIAVISSEGSATVLSGITIRNGYHGTLAGGMQCSNASPTVTDCVFSECFGELGGGVACQGTAAPRFIRCRFEADSAGIGAGAWATNDATPTFEACVFSGNHCRIEAGGISLQYSASVVMRDCVFMDNAGGYRGGGLLADDNSIVDVTGSTFVSNTSSGGGGAYCCAASRGTFRDCTFQANAAAQGAQLCCGCMAIATLENCLLTFGIHGAGVHCWSSGEAHLACSDVFGNAAGDWVGYIATQAGVEGNISADPVYCDAAARDLTLHAGSPCLAGHHPAGYDCGLIGAWGLGCPSVDTPEDAPSPTAWRLAIAGANPFTGSTWIACRVPEAARGAALAVFDLAGRRVRSLAPAGLPAGAHRVAWDGNDDFGRPAPAGVYHVRLTGPGAGLEGRVCRIR